MGKGGGGGPPEVPNQLGLLSGGTHCMIDDVEEGDVVVEEQLGKI